jgi:hypothetical protein
MTVPDHHINNNDVLLLPLDSSVHAHSASDGHGVYDFSDSIELGQTARGHAIIENSGSSAMAYDQQRRKHDAFDDNFKTQSPEELTNVFDMLDRMDVVEEDRILMDTLKAYPPENPLSSPGDTLGINQESWHQPTQQHVPKVCLASDQHPGNNRFYIHVSINRQKFMKAYNSGNEATCNEIAKNIINTVCFQSYPRGRFLEYDPLSSNDDWIHIGHGQSVIDQVKGALKDPPDVRLSKFSYHTQGILPEEKPLTKRNTNSNDITLQTDYSQTGSSYRDASTYRESYLSSANVDTSYKETSYTGTSCRDTYSQFDTEASMRSTTNAFEDGNPGDSGSETQKRKKGMRRRGMISSDVPTKSKKFDVNGDLTKLVQSVFNQPLENGTFADSDGSECSAFSIEKPKRPKHSIIAHSVASSTSSISGLHSDFANGLKIESTKSIASSRKYRGSSSFKRKKSAGASKERASTIIPEHFNSVQVKIVDETTGSNQTRPLSNYDILCTKQPRPGIMPINQIGNNRFRIMLQIYHGKYNSEDIEQREKNCIIYMIFQEILKSKKGRMRFIYQVEDDNDVWTQMPNEEIPKFITSCIEECENNPNLVNLPSLKERPWVSNIVRRQRRKQVTIDDLQQAALKNIKGRRKKRYIISRDPDTIAELQAAVLGRGGRRR